MLFPWIDSLKQEEILVGKNDPNRGAELMEGLAALPYYERLTRFIRGSVKHWVKGDVTIIDLRPFYSVNVHHLQRQLAEEIRKIETEEVTDLQLDHIRGRLHEYTNALRDFEFIHANRWNTLFVKDIAASRLDNGPQSKLQRALIEELGLTANEAHRSLFRDSDLLGSFDHSLMQQSTAIGMSLGRERQEIVVNSLRYLQYRMTLKRFAFAIVGGLIIVIPFFILATGTVTTKALAVIATSILLFAISVAIFSETEAENLLAITAAYAAILMALIGGGSTVASN